MHESILIIFGTNITEKVGNEQVLYFLPHITNASALPGQMQNTKIATFHSNAVPLHYQTSTSCWLNLFSLVT